MSLAELITQRRILVTMGPGGVGKTTVAAALGLQAAVEGKRALVLTLDPALRLANALGLDDVPAGERRELSTEMLQAAGVPAKVPLTVEMLDTQKAWAGAICREVVEPRQRERILAHPFFKRMSADLAGAREYAAMEELYHLYLRGRFDLVVLDTPPTVHGVDIIEAPDRVLEVLEHDAYRWLMRPALLAGKLGLRILNFSGGYVVRTLSRFTGLDFLKELAGFVDLFSGLLEGFRQRAAAVKATLRSPVTAFVLITAADPNLTQESVYLYRRLQHRELTPQAVVVNRVVFAPAPLPNELDWRAVLLQAASAAGAAPPEADALVDAMEQAHTHLADLARRSEAQLTKMRESLFGTCSLNAVPLMESDVHDLAGLEQLRAALFETAAP
jgi:anion-transporting  ArsA/GET3 family ATPase